MTIDVKFELLKNQNYYCKGCGNCFKPKGPYELTCSPLCKEILKLKQEILREKLLTSVCVYCGKEIRKTNLKGNSSVCEWCRYANRRKESICDNTKIRKKTKQLPLEELERRAEYKRLMDEGWANRTIRGIKWG